MMVRRTLAAAFLLLAMASPARADFAAGMAAYEAGYYATAYDEILPLAEAGDANAQYRFGVLYD